MYSARTLPLQAAGTQPREEAVDRWREAISSTHLPWELRADQRTVEESGKELTVQRVGPLSLVECRCGPCSGHRGPRQLADSPDEYVGALFVLGGTEILVQDGTETALAPGMAVIWDSTRPARFTVPSYIEKRTVFIPRARAAGLVPGGAQPAGTVLRAGHATRLLDGFLAALLRTAQQADAPEVERSSAAVVNATLELLSHAVEAQSPPSTSWQERRWATVRDYVEEHLTDPGLDPATIAREAGMSVRSLYVLFSTRGDTVARYVKRLRLARARAELERAGGEVTVAAVARRWGFADQGTFTRAFRQRYGVTPAEVRP